MSIESVPSTMRDARSRSLVDSSHKEFPLRESFYHYARRAFPHGRNVAMKRARFIVRALCRWRLHDVWLKLLEAPQLRPIVERQPLLYAKIQREYVLNGIGAASRLALLSGHFAEYLQRVPRSLTTAIYSNTGLRLYTLECAGGPYEMRLCHLGPFWQEGEISIGLFEASERIGSVTFLLCNPSDLAPGLDAEGLAFAIGGIQGVNDDNGHGVFRKATKAMHGLRPFSLLIYAARIVAQCLGANRLLAVGDARHTLGYKRAKNKLHLQYDAVWRDHGGTSLSGDVFDLGLYTFRKDLADVSSNKRAQYRRRYTLMQALEHEIRASLKACA